MQYYNIEPYFTQLDFLIRFNIALSQFTKKI
jgi:hypothetical protein